MDKKKTIGLLILSLIVVGSISAVLAYTIVEQEPETIEFEETASLESGALSPDPSRGIVRYSNPRYKDGSMIDWQSKTGRP